MQLDDHFEFFKEEKEETLDWFQKEIVSLRTGRVKPDLVERIPVEHYGSRSPLNSLAGISNSDARTLVISPWDPGAKDAIAKALTDAQLGAMPNIDSNVIRLVFPTLTEEVRERTVKMLHQKSEEARIRLRQSRDEALKSMKDDKEKGVITEDDWYDGKKKLDELIDGANEEIEKKVAAKEKEIKEV